MKSPFFNHRSWLEEYKAMMPFDEKPPEGRGKIDTISLNEQVRIAAQEAFEARKAEIAERVLKSRIERERNYSNYKAQKSQP